MDLNAAPVTDYRILDNRQAQPSTRDGSDIAGTVEAFKQMGLVGLRYANALV